MNLIPDPVPKELRRRLAEAADAMGKHIEACPLCSRDKYHAMRTLECPAFSGIVMELDEAAKAMDPRWFKWAVNLLPRVLPAEWREVQRTYQGAVYHGTDLVVLLSGDWQEDGRRWLHVSASVKGQGRLPSWPEMQSIKSLFIGREKTAYQTFPAASRHVNLGEVMHLWHCLDGDPLPDFTRGSAAP